MSGAYCDTHGSQSRVWAAASTVASNLSNASASSSRGNTVLLTGETRTLSRRVCRAASDAAEHPTVTERRMQRHLERAENGKHDAHPAERVRQCPTLQIHAHAVVRFLHDRVYTGALGRARCEVHGHRVFSAGPAPR